MEPFGIKLVPESNGEMRGSYSMLDAKGRFFTNDSDGFTGHVYGRSIFDLGSVEEAWSDVARCFSRDSFKAREGIYDWGQNPVTLESQKELWGMTVRSRNGTTSD